ncbi:MAG: DUF362 domain-containing protein [Endomicrobium sp.]|jgi:uncharacterized Fe-S center protein|nr:DUF362 domain-containing protein [Endomicrobium sp.]
MASKVYFLPWDRRGELYGFLKKAGVFSHVKARQYLAIKIHFGEEGNDGYIKPEYVAPAVKIAKEKTAFPFLTDASTIYVGKRADAYHHLLLAEKHGFNIANCGCPVIIADGLRGNAEEKVEVDFKHFKNVTIARDIFYSDSFIFLNHFKGHEVTGFGGALKNMGMGCGSKAGKYAMHHSSKPKVKADKCKACGQCVKWCAQGALKLVDKKIVMDADKCVGCGQCIVMCAFGVFGLKWNEGTIVVQEKIVEYAAAVVKGKKSSSINFLNHISKFCDCFAMAKNPPVMEDIGIMAGNDPVAVDQASYDMVKKVYGKDLFKELYPDIDPSIQLEYAQTLAMGSRDYELIKY